MNNYLIEVENLSKSYSTNWHKDQSDIVNALSNANFKVLRGDCVGVIGKNGSGKSTLLGLLSGIIKPSTGQIKLTGKVSSILDVGSGFHPELTGRENVLLMGKMLGLNNSEISSLTSEIIKFSEIEGFIDLPIKKYSSGMYLRLAMAVALHTKNEILIIDEVISVGDVEFKLKIMDKLSKMRQDGLTMVLASHNMNEILQMCNKCLLIENGKIIYLGKTFDCIQKYLETINHQGKEIDKESVNNFTWNWHDKDFAPGNEIIKIRNLSLIPLHRNIFNCLFIEDSIVITVEFWKFVSDIDIQLLFLIYDAIGNPIFYLTSLYDDHIKSSISNLYKRETGLFKMSCIIPSNFLNHGKYFLELRFGKGATDEIYIHPNKFLFQVNENPNLNYFSIRDFSIPVRPQFKWSYEKI